MTTSMTARFPWLSGKLTPPNRRWRVGKRALLVEIRIVGYFMQKCNTAKGKGLEAVACFWQQVGDDALAVAHVTSLHIDLNQLPCDRENFKAGLCTGKSANQRFFPSHEN